MCMEKIKQTINSRKQQIIFDFRLYLVHTSLVESHDGGVSESVEHCPQGLLGVQLLRFEQLLQELLIEHGGNDIIHNYDSTNTERVAVSQKQVCANMKLKTEQAECSLYCRKQLCQER